MIAWAVDTLIGVTVLMMLVLALRQPVAHFLGARWAYALWLLPLLRIFMPPLDLFGSDLSLPRDTVILIPAVGEAAASSAPSEGAGLLPLLLALWAGGAAVFISWQQAAYGAFMLGLGQEGRRSKPGEFHGIPVIESETVDGPLAVGFLKRRIVVPLDFATRYSIEEQRLALEHELVHHRRGDIWWNLAALAVLTVNWFNPIAHFAFRAFRTDQELACDEAVAVGVGGCNRHDYARALVKSACRPGQIAACPLNSADQLKRRLKMMKQHRASRARTLAGGVAVSGLIAGGLLFAAPGLAQEEESDANVFVVERNKDSNIISEADVATLQRKCGGKRAIVTSGSSDQGTILCGGREVDDPEVRAIVDRTVARAEAVVKEKAAHIAAAEKAAERAQVVVEKIEKEKIVERALADSHETLKQVDVEKLRAHAHEAMASARIQMARIDMKGMRAVAMARPVPRVPLSAEQRAEIEAAMAEARAELADLGVDQEELQRELREAERERREALREAEQAREEALREAAEAIREADAERREALMEAAEARREAMREAAEARREATRARREAEREQD
jgi:bla regulator protein BlaR1